MWLNGAYQYHRPCFDLLFAGFGSPVVDVPGQMCICCGKSLLVMLTLALCVNLAPAS